MSVGFLRGERLGARKVLFFCTTDIILLVDKGFRYRKEFLFYKAIIQLSKFQESCIQITSLSLFPTLKKNPELILRGKVEVFKSKMVMVFIVYNIFLRLKRCYAVNMLTL